MTKLLAALLFASLPYFGLSAQNQFLKPEGLAPATGYSHVVVTQPGKLVFIAGQVASNRRGQLVGKDDLRAQTVQVFENIKTALAAAGATLDDVVKINYYVKGYKPESLATVREVRNLYVNKAAPPASVLVGVTSLVQEDYLIEVDAVAVIAAKSPQKAPAAKDQPARKKSSAPPAFDSGNQ
jgi:enamine deaminase RidA (YjgF/YER057c/UK114 family)